jgi:UDP-GlcNAc:undecaprenyl-phosphate GlcNAc-1-phosphate transferase
MILKYLNLVNIAIFIGSIVFSFLLNQILVKFSKNLGTRNNVNEIRWTTGKKPAIGGISFFVTFLLSLLFIVFLTENFNFFYDLKLVGLILAATISFLMGLYDDAFNTNVFIKLFSQIAAGVILITTGTCIHLFHLDYLNYALTVLWIIGIMNAINLLDNMDGIASSISLFILFGIYVLNLNISTTIEVNFLILGIMGALIGFLMVNWPPSKIFMGDTGSQFLGMILASLSIMTVWNNPNQEILTTYKPLIAILVLFALPIIDTTTVTYKRIARKRSPLIGGKDHITHHLSYIGLSDKWVAGTIMILSAISAFLTILIFSIKNWHQIYYFLFLGWFLLLFGVLFYIANLNKDKN